VHEDALLALERRLEQRVARRQRHAVVAALDDEVDGREQRFHLGQPGFVVPEEVGPRERGERWKHMARREGHLVVGVVCYIGEGWGDRWVCGLWWGELFFRRRESGN
jgi:hypothetical protein